MTREHKWSSRVLDELKLVWLVVEDVFYDVLHPTLDCESGAAAEAHVPTHDFNTMTITQLVCPDCHCFQKLPG